MKSVYVEQLTESLKGKTITDIFQVAQVSVREKKDKTLYLDMTVKDRSGSANCKIWDGITNDMMLPDAGSFVKIQGVLEFYKNSPQIKIGKWKPIPHGEIDLADFIPASKRDRQEMFHEVIDTYVASITNARLRVFVRSLLCRFPLKVQGAPAAKGMHQPYLGGLLEHTLRLCAAADGIVNAYRGWGEDKLNRDLLIAACILHDIGKVDELTYDTNIDYSRRGKLVGHVAIGLQLFYHHRVTTDLQFEPDDEVLFDHLEHIIASHHGQVKWGATVVPKSREASIFHLLDMVDSRMAGFDMVEEVEPRDGDGFTLRNHKLLDNEGTPWFPNGKIEVPDADASDPIPPQNEEQL